MLKGNMLRAPEGDGPSGAGAAIAAAGEAAVSRVESENAQPVQSAEPTQASEPSQTQTTPASESSSAYDFNYKGRAHKLTRAEVDYLLAFGADAYERAAAQTQAKPKEPEVPPDEFEKRVGEMVEQRTKPLSEKIESYEREKAMAQITKEADAAMAKHDIFKKFDGDSKKSQFMKGVVMYLKGCNPDMPFDMAAKQVADIFDGLVSSEKAAYVQEKISAAGKRVDGSGGSPPAPGAKKLGAKDFREGNVFNAALERAIRASAST
jgi:hypothetical protein